MAQIVAWGTEVITILDKLFKLAMAMLVMNQITYYWRVIFKLIALKVGNTCYLKWCKCIIRIPIGQLIAGWPYNLSSKSGHFWCEKDILLIITPVKYGQTMIVSGKPRHMYKMKKWSGYHEKSANLNPLYSSSAFKEVSNPPGSMINTRLHSTEPPG